MSVIRNLPGGPYKTVCVIDLFDTLIPHSRALFEAVGRGDREYVNRLLIEAIWIAGRSTHVLVSKVPTNIDSYPTEIKRLVNEAALDIGRVLYRALAPLQYTAKGLTTLSPDSIIHHKGEILLCWKGGDLGS